jgi:ABC-type spermidine/putrescine transport system permease subunit I
MLRRIRALMGDKMIKQLAEAITIATVCAVVCLAIVVLAIPVALWWAVADWRIARQPGMFGRDR